MKEINESTIIRFIQGRCSDEELAAVGAWLEASDDNARELFRIERTYRDAVAAGMGQRRVDKALKRVRQHIAADEARDEEENRAIHRRDIIMRWRRLAAAVAFVAIGGAAVWMYRTVTPKASQNIEYVTAYAPTDATRSITLPDGSRVWLNKGSQLKYATTFGDSLRNVELTGEGYFEVAHNAAKPFVVSSSDMSVRVLGTVFDFKTGDRNNHIAEVSLIQGSVEARSLKSPGTVVLTPGQKARLDCKAGRMTVENVDARLDAVWHDGMIPFDNATIGDIARTLERLYGVKIRLDASVDRSSTYSGSIIRKNNIDSVLLLMQNALPIKYSRHGRMIVITGE